MKKLLVKFLKFLIKKLVKPTHYEYKMSEKTMQEIDDARFKEVVINSYKNPPVAENSQKSEPVGKEVEELLYFFCEANFSVEMDNIPKKMIQSYYFRDKETVEFEIYLGGDDKFDVYEELEKKKFRNNTNPDGKENVEIQLFSGGNNKKIVLENVKIISLETFFSGNYNSNNICKAFVLMRFENKKIEKI